MDADDYMADQLLNGNVGAVGAVDVGRRVVGGGTSVGYPAVMPRYVGAPAQMIEQPDAPAVQYSPSAYVAGDVSWMGLGATLIPAGGQGNVTVKPIRPITPQKLLCPSNVQNMLLLKASIGGTNIFASTNGIPIEIFSEVSTAPQIDWPTLDPAVGIEFTLQNLEAFDQFFKGALYGTSVRR